MKTIKEFIYEAVDNYLTYNGQLQFKRSFIRFANKTLGKDVLKRKKVDISIYFDGNNCVDPNNDKTIPGVKCNGKMTWAEANEKLIDYLHLRNPWWIVHGLWEQTDRKQPRGSGRNHHDCS